MYSIYRFSVKPGQNTKETIGLLTNLHGTAHVTLVLAYFVVFTA